MPATSPKAYPNQGDSLGMALVVGFSLLRLSVTITTTPATIAIVPAMTKAFGRSPKNKKASRVAHRGDDENKGDALAAPILRTDA